MIRRAAHRAWIVALAAGLAAGCGDPPRPSVDRVLLITIDTLRADRIGAYGDEDASTPTLDALARIGVRFDQAVSPAPLTRPSHSTLLTGLEPPAHGVRGNSFFALDPDIPMLSERFQEAGYATGAFVAAFVLDSRFGLDRGFDVYDDDITDRRAADSPFAYAERPADEVVDATLAWIRTAPERFFAWVHLYDPHANYAPPPAFARQHPDDPYAGEIAFADAQVGRLIDGVRARFGLENLAILVTSDHGESLGEHGEATHALTVYDATQRVPMILVAQGVGRGTVDAQVRLADVAPTLLELADLPPLPDTDGRSLLRLAMGEAEPEERLAYVEAIEPQISMGWSPVLGVRSEGYKYLRAPRPELYDLAMDPGEKRNLASSEPERVAALDARVEAVASRARPTVETTLSAEDRARLEALGYLVPEGEGLEDVPLGQVGGPDPKDHMAEASAVQRASAFLSEGRGERALALLAPIQEPGPYVLLMRANAAVLAGRSDVLLATGEALVALDASQAAHHYTLGLGLLGEKRLDDAERAFEAVRDIEPDAASAALGLGMVARERGESEAALAWFERADELEERPGAARLQLALTHLRAGRADAGQEALDSLPADFAQRLETQIRVADALLALGRTEDALARMEDAARRDPRSPMAWGTLAGMRQRAGQLDGAVAAWRRQLDLDPRDAAAMNDLAWGLALAGQDLDEALRLSQQATAQLGRSPELLDTLASVHLARGEASESLALIDEALPGAGRSLRGHLLYLRAATLLELGQREEARRSLGRLAEEADALEPFFRSRADALARELGVEPLDPAA